MALKTKLQFSKDVKAGLKNGLNEADIYEMVRGYENVTNKDVAAILKTNLVNSAIQIQNTRDDKELLKTYNIADKIFIERNPYIVVFEQGENITYYNYKEGVYVLMTKNNIKDSIHEMFTELYLLDYRGRTKIDDTFLKITSLLQYKNNKRFNNRHQKKWYINVKNGLLDPATSVLHPHTPDYFSTSQASFDYEPDAVCPTFIEAVELSARNAEGTYKMLQELFGYMIGIEGNPAHKIFYFHGMVARNGKSTMAEILIGLLGFHNVSTLSIENLTSPSDSLITPLINTHMNFSDEANASKHLDSGRLTSMTAQGTITISPKYEAPFSYTVRSKFLVACNYLPKFQSPQGLKQRTIVIPFNYFLPIEDRIFEYSKFLLEKEGSGILNWALEGYKILKKQNMQFTISELSAELGSEMEKSNDSVLSFLDLAMDISLEKYEPKITTKKLYDKYVTYCHEYGHGIAKSFRSFATSMKTFEEEHHTIKYHTKDPRGYSGLSFKDGLLNLTQ